MLDEICGALGLGQRASDTVSVAKSEVSEPIPYNDADELVSPFIAYEDGYRWPDLYTELDECLEACVLIYPMAELRKKARAGELDNPEQILNLPLTYSKVMDYVQANRDKLGDSSMAQDFYVSVLQTAEDRYMMHTKSEMKTLAKDMNATEDEKKEDAQATALPPLKLSPCSIIAFDDKYEKDELVYSIQVNHVRQLIMVCFRGTVTKTDWATDFEIYMKAVPNPIKHHQTQKPTIKIHNGFYDYLFEKTERGAKGPNGEPLSEYEEILQEHVMPVLKQFPGYKLYVTGHSLGGALATLFAFEAAAAPDSEIPKPVSLFSIASPYVGDESFRAAHQILESQGKLRHLRLSNHKDVVTIVPKMSWRWRFYDSSSSVGSLFKHVGMNIRLFEGDYAPEINYPAVRTGVWTSTYEEMSRGWEQTLFWNFSWNPLDYYLWPWHGVSAYSHRLRANAPSLKSMSLNELYSRKDIVGNLVPQF